MLFSYTSLNSWYPDPWQNKNFNDYKKIKNVKYAGGRDHYRKTKCGAR